MNAHSAKRIAWLLAAIMSAVLWALILLGPPTQAPPGLDGAWRIAITDAGLRGFVFGRDVIFTFGPLGWLIQGTPIAARAIPYLVFQVAVVAGLISATFICLRTGPSLLQRVCVSAAVAGITIWGTTIDYLLIYACLLALGSRALRLPRRYAPMAVMLGGLAGLGFVSRMACGIYILAATGAFFSVQAAFGPRQTRWRAVRAIIWMAIAFTFAVLVVFDGSVADALAYSRNGLDIVAGYSEAMTWTAGTGTRTLLLALGEAAVFGGVCFALVAERAHGLAAALAIAVFLAWKHGFVRQDEHLAYFFSTVTVCFLVASVNIRRRRPAMIAGFATCMAIVVWAPMMQFTRFYPISSVINWRVVSEHARYVWRPIETTAALERASQTALTSSRLPASLLAAIGDRSINVQPTDLSVIRANGLNWRPEPVLQNYSAYTSHADQLVMDALQHRGPERILYSFRSIDGRYPFADQPASQALAACLYSTEIGADGHPAIDTVPDDLGFLLDRRPRNVCTAEPAGDVVGPFSFGQVISVPRPKMAGADFVQASIEIEPTLMGRIFVALFRGPVLRVMFTYEDGTTREWRLVRATTRDGLIVNPAPTQDAEAADFFASRMPPNVLTMTISVSQPACYRIESIHFSNISRTAR